MSREVLSPTELRMPTVASVANTLRLTFVNPTAGSVTPTAGTYTFLVIKGS